MFSNVAVSLVATGNPVALTSNSLVVGNVLQGRVPFLNPGAVYTPSGSTLGIIGLPVAACLNRPLDTVTPSFQLRADEGYGVAARTRGFTPGNPLLDQNLGNYNYNTESGFYSTAFGATNGLNRAGIADTGTRYRFVFKNVPPGVQLYSPVAINAAAHTLTLVDSDATTSGAPFPLDSFSALAATNGNLRELSARGADRIAVYEATLSEPATIGRFTVPFHLSHGSGVAAATVPVESSFAPYLPEPNPAASSTLPIPRFNSGAVQVNAFTLQNCNSCGSILNTAIARRIGTNGQALWTVRISNNGYNAVAGGIMTLTLTRVAGTGSVTSPAPVAFGVILPGQSIDVPVLISATDFTMKVRAQFTYSGGCFATTNTLNFQPLL